MSIWIWLDEVTKLLIPGRYFSCEDNLLNLLDVIIGIIILYYLVIDKRKKMIL